MNGVRQENDSLEELVRQLKLSFLALDSKNKNGEIKQNDNLKNCIIPSSQVNSNYFINNLSKIASEFLPEISISKNNCKENAVKRKIRRRKQRITNNPVNNFCEHAQQSNKPESLRQADKFLIKFRNSRLLVEFVHGNFSDHSTRNVCGQHAHGYSQINANYAISRLTRRDLLRTENTLYSKPTSNLRWSEECICRKCISVPSLNISSTNPRHFVFESNGLTNTEAEMDCNLRILAELWDFDMIKEANMELYTLGRKELLDPTRKLNLKLFAWLEASTDTWVSKMNEIEEYQGLEGLIFEKNLFLN
uniref:Uncharacterized protein n=1 Tax=Meloidogyne enterolobii TaxID=390850 RepID=A0A6V7X282_MELEN|nr:unnamed protein product [Meloidogyne enterolobii]